MSDDLGPVLAAVGPRLRAVRRNRGVTLAEMAETTGISISTLSRLETSRLRPTLEQLLPLARAHGVALDELVGAPPSGDPRVHLRPVRRHGHTYLPLSRGGGSIQAYKIVYPGRRRSGPVQTRTHDGYEWFYVLSGRVRFVLGDQEYVLAAGEAAEFDTRVPHWHGSADQHPAEVLSLFGRQGERAHLAVRGS